MSVSIVNRLLSTADKGELSLFLDIIKNSGTETDETPPSQSPDVSQNKFKFKMVQSSELFWQVGEQLLEAEQVPLMRYESLV